MERTIIILGGVAIVVGGVMKPFPILLPQWVWVPLTGIGVLTIVYGVFKPRRPSPAYYGVPSPDKWIWNWSAPIIFERAWPLSRIVPLKKAARLAYEATKGTEVARAAEAANFDVLGYYCNALFDGSTTLLGNRPPSMKLEAIPDEESNRGGFTDNYSAFRRHGADKNLYEGIHIRRSDIRKRVKNMRAKS